MKAQLKRLLRYRPSVETEHVRAAINTNSVNPGLPFTTPCQGDFLFNLIRSNGCKSALEVGFATGSTAAYMLAGMQTNRGMLISIDPKPEDYLNVGTKLLNNLGYSDRHKLEKRNSALALPDLISRGQLFD